MTEQDAIPLDHPDRYALEYIDAKICQHNTRAHNLQRSEDERRDHKSAAFALGIVRGDIFARLHRPSPIAEPCPHPVDKQISDFLSNVGPTLRCEQCGEHRPVKTA